MKTIKLLSILSLALFLGLASCDTASDNGQTGTMEVKMTDAPANYDAVVVTINSVRVKQDEDDSDDADGEEAEDGDDDEEEWVTIMDESMQVNLLELTNGNEVTLGSKELEAGNYSQIRFILGDDNTVTVDGETYALTTPSAQQSGLKLDIDAEVEEGSSYTLLVDFDAARSIVETGNGMYILKPVLRAVNLSETGSISGNVQPTDFNTNVMATADGDTLSTITNDNGDFKIMGVAEGTYDVTFDPGSDQYADSTQTDIEVEEGEENDLGTIELEQNGTQ